MGFPADDNADNLAPASDAGVNSPRTPQLLAGTGTTEDHNGTGLSLGARGTLVVGAQALRVTFRTSAGLAAQVAADDLRLAAGSTFTWLVEHKTRFVYCEADGGIAAYEAWVYTSSPGNR